MEMNVETIRDPSEVTIAEYEKGLVIRDGKVVKELSAGRHKVGPGVAGDIVLSLLGRKKSYEVRIVDLRQKSLTITGQEILTRDKIGVRVNVVVQYAIRKPKLALFSVDNFVDAMYQDVQLAIREYVSATTLDELLFNKNKLGPAVQKKLQKTLAEFGVELVKVGLKDVILPGDVRNYMNLVVAAEREAKAKLIAARQEVASARAFKNAAEIIAKDKNVWKLKQLDTIKEIAKSPANKVFFGLGDELLDALRK